MASNHNLLSPKALIFDCFGVIISDQVGMTLSALSTSDPPKGAEVYALLKATNEGVISWQDFVNQAAAVMGIEPVALNARFTQHEVKNTELLMMIQRWRKHYKTALLTNVSVQGFWERFTPAELLPYFDVLLLSGETGVAKPEAAAYELAAERLGERCDQCIMIDDRPEYCDGARAVGMQAVRYKSVPHLLRELAQYGIGLANAP